jgi:glycosyltransferase involved in cell wall biosynthesis
VSLVREETLGLSTARNTGIRTANGSAILVLDDDAIPWPHWLPNLVHGVSEDGVYAAGGPVEPKFTSELPAWISDRFLPYLTILIIGPWVIGKVVELLLDGRLFQKQRNVRAVVKMENRLATQLKAGGHRGYRVALVNYPSLDNRSLGLIVADFSEPETERELVAVYLPGTPDPTKGAMRGVAKRDLTLTDWDLSDLARFHLTLGSVSP